MPEPDTTPTECGPACAEAHTYRLSDCALSCKEIGGGIADMSWTVPCPACKTMVGFPCYRTDGSAAGVSCGKRWDAYRRAQDSATPTPAGPAETIARLRQRIAAVEAERDGWAEALNNLIAIDKPSATLHAIRQYAESRCTEEHANLASAAWVLHLLDGGTDPTEPVSNASYLRDGGQG